MVRAQPSGGVVLDPSFYVNGPPTSKFRENLKPSFKYITAFDYGGFTNDYMVWCNMIYLAVISRRIPILGPLLPMKSHLGAGGKTIDFGEIFDLPRLSQAIQTPILQWSDVKKASGAETDFIGCWSLWPTVNKNAHEPHGSALPSFLHLGIVWTQAPNWIKLTHDGGFTASLSALAKMLLPEGRQQVLSTPEARAGVTYDGIPEEISAQLYPDDQLACFDILYWVGVTDTYEWEKHNHPVWELVGTNLHFTQNVEDIASEYLRRLFGMNGLNETEIPPYISVHVRHSDFLHQCGDVKLEDCAAPLSAYVRRVKQVQDELAIIHGPDSPLAKVQNVVVTSDERDPKWWTEVHNLGWLGTNKFDEEIGTKYGRWFPTVIDAVIQSRGKAFVGTQGSTMSDYAARRVQDWQHGPWKLVCVTFIAHYHSELSLFAWVLGEVEI
ncbi:hypothetical protein M407DRAFT_65342 [Tulasnella calospora MUT 4182]|uniref:Uncharacterized protein n=1 Tax=Tulasnella calospora MUT 4182 TaxID=1051891 RepID=A0A0C3QXA6_9AGAM|nr:hypothetical protein M407DRAFT_65342 [Tulasnella calospora MUT 4182]